jgi:phenylpropionate dioxygenase-like ring-hydroxylating dioxygenase large terminal subunit
LHRNARLSHGRVEKGLLVCPYHGWRYGSEGKLKSVPSEGPQFVPGKSQCLPQFAALEKDGYVYVRLGQENEFALSKAPFGIPHYKQRGYQHIRLKHTFKADVSNCAENFIDIPHTTYVHPGVFRYEKAPQKIAADVERENSNVHIRYRNETSNFGWFSKFLNSSDKEIFHEDHYYFPNVTHVEYRFGKRMNFHITSQSIPMKNHETLVYTDLTYDYGIWNWIARPFVWWAAKKIIGQDVKIMGEQSEVIEKYGELFSSTKADIHHVWIERIYAALKAGENPNTLGNGTERIEFYI